MNKIVQYVWIELKLLFRVPINLFFTIAFPLMLLAVFVALSDNKLVFGDYHFVDVYLPISMLISMFSSGIISFAITVAGNRNQKLWQTYRLRGFRIYQLVLSQLFVNIVLCLISAVLLTIFAVLVFQAKVPSATDILIFVPIWLVAALSVFMIGFVIGVAVKSEKTAQAVATPLMFVMLIASGIMFNFSSFPASVQEVLKYLPTTQANWMLVAYWNQSPSSSYQILWWVMAVWIAVSLTFAVFRLYRDNFRRL